MIYIVRYGEFEVSKKHLKEKVTTEIDPNKVLSITRKDFRKDDNDFY